MADNTRIVIGIDPASGDKGSHVFAPDVPDPDGKISIGDDEKNDTESLTARPIEHTVHVNRTRYPATFCVVYPDT